MVRVSLVPRLVSFTVAPDTVAPLASVTVPTTVPNLTWALTSVADVASVAKTKSIANSGERRRFVLDPLPSLRSGKLAGFDETPAMTKSRKRVLLPTLFA